MAHALSDTAAHVNRNSTTDCNAHAVPHSIRHQVTDCNAHAVPDRPVGLID